ncbi:Asp-tRNA(Asn)/Glu-tRNA(Gln) amidotransferase A subunit family amidase [Nocardia transvalensis]|uniref:Asp-tRNA(Asn)/Glu-tRNA(Gln) amidotransferase A subunit family amidase n=1 Tax=Nocardia transvalensis TaxID=37333 RepID=A0A7W9PGR9_9NOCA|nr:amidase [Nocardia transvalensis]MBB5915625.1 Asp-tRNA(Asn)/Glu-tRNA(Gln) amidotransferase A subunit family amidase [Nocardia transvalensis]
MPRRETSPLRGNHRLRPSRRTFLGLAGAAGLGLAAPAPTRRLARARTIDDSLTELPIHELRSALDSGALSARELVSHCLDRIAAFDQAGPGINALITVNPDALDTAAAIDAMRTRTTERGPLHGIPIVLKDNIDTADLPTTAGSALFRDYVPGRDATVTRLLRQAGAIVLGKANMHEWAIGTTTVSSLGGQTRNPYDRTRSPGGSSGGTAAAVATGFAVAGLGTDTLGSIRIPAARTNCVGIRPTAGMVSRAGIIPLSVTQDAVGPIARTVADAALLLDVISGPDPADPTTVTARRPPRGYVSLLNPNALAGKRIGVVDDFFGDPADADCAATNAVIERALGDMAGLGAEIVHINDLAGLAPLAAELTEFEFREALDSYLDASLTTPPARTLAEIIASETAVPDVQAVLVACEPLTTASPMYVAATAARASLIRYMTDVLEDNRLDALLYPTMQTPALPTDWYPPERTGETLAEGRSPVTGLPAITIPAGFTPDHLPVGVELLGRPLDDGKLIAMAYAYEQATGHRTPPSWT